MTSLSISMKRGNGIELFLDETNMFYGTFEQNFTVPSAPVWNETKSQKMKKKKKKLLLIIEQISAIFIENHKRSALELHAFCVSIVFSVLLFMSFLTANEKKNPSKIYFLRPFIFGMSAAAVASVASVAAVCLLLTNIRTKFTKMV